jgi:hypothetical protein
MFTYGRMEDNRMIITDGYKGLEQEFMTFPIKFVWRNPMKPVPK